MAAKLEYVRYDPLQEPLYLPIIRGLISRDLSEPYSIYVYRYFLYQWPDLCFMALEENETASAPPHLIGVIICKLEPHRDGPMRGYIAMLAVRQDCRGKGIASKLVMMAVEAMKEQNADEVRSIILPTVQTVPD